MGMGAPTGRGSRTVVSEINVTPFVDVMLVLLVIFMVTTPMMQQGIEIDLPETASSGVPTKDEPFIIVIKKNKEILAGQTKTSFQNLAPRLKAIFKNRKNKQVYLQADRQVDYGFVAETMAEIRSAGIFQIGLITMPKTAP